MVPKHVQCASLNSKTPQTVTLTRIQWASLLINLQLLRQTTIVEYLTNEISDQVGLPIVAEEQLVPAISADHFYN